MATKKSTSKIKKDELLKKVNKKQPSKSTKVTKPTTKKTTTIEKPKKVTVKTTKTITVKTNETKKEEKPVSQKKVEVKVETKKKPPTKVTKKVEETKKDIKIIEDKKKEKNTNKLLRDEFISDDELKTRIDLPVIKDVVIKKKPPTLKDYDIGKTKVTNTKYKIFLLNMCKVLLTCVKFIKLFFVTSYNTIKRLILNVIKNIKNRPKKEKEVKTKNIEVSNKDTIKTEIKDDKILKIKEELKKNKKRKLSKEEKKLILNMEDNPGLLRYKDYSFLCWLGIFFVNRIKVMIFDMKRFGKKFKYGTFMDKILILFMLVLIAGFSCIIAFCCYIVASAPEISEKRLYKSNSTILLDKNGVQFARLGTENREKVYYDELPEVLIDAIVSAEDSRYFQHNGIDLARFTKAVIQQLMGRSDAGGGSTLTMQVSKNAATSVEASGLAGIIRKFTDIYLSVFVFEKKFTKEQIMEFYVNIPYLGSGAYGVQQASKTYFGKSVSELNLAEAATIAGLFQAPGAYDPYIAPQSAQSRRNTILNLMHRHGYITEEERDAAKAIPIKSMLAERKSSANKYQDFIDTVITYTIKETNMDPTVTSMTIYTTMDPKKQDVVNGIINGETYKWKNDYAQAGIAVVDVKDGSIAAVGASRDPGQRVMNFALEARRHPGSTAKPVIDYGPAIEYLGWGTGTTVIDDKYTYSSKAWIKNFDNGYKGVMTAKTALAQSRNIPALYTFQQTTNEDKKKFAEGLGWKPGHDGNGILLESDSIGGFEGVTPMESAAAYATFARGGLYIEPYAFYKIEFQDENLDPVEIKPTPKKVMEESTAFIINMILRYAVTSGSVGAGSVSGTDVCAKTGTSTVDSAAKKAAGITGNLIGDSWEVAYSPDYAISTWYGYKTQLDPKYHLTSAEGGTARKTITKILTSGILPKNSTFKRPSTVSSVEVELGTDPLMLPSAATPSNLRSVEYFRKGTEPSEVSPRFATLDNPSGLKYSSNDYSVTLRWNNAPTPNAINPDKIREEMSKNIYNHWLDKYVQERINYNNSTLGAFGYEIYMTNANGTVDLGFTTSNVFTANVQFDAATSFTVKSAYQYFKSNQSSGVTVQVQPNSASPEDTPGTQDNHTENVDFTVRYKPTCTTLNDFKNTTDRSKFEILTKENPPRNITNDPKVNITLSYDEGCTESSPTCDGTYTIRYGQITKQRNVQIKQNCP